MPDIPLKQGRRGLHGATRAASAKPDLDPDLDKDKVEQIISLVGEIYLTFGSLRSLFGTSNARLNMAALEVITLGAVVEQPVPLTVAQIGRLCGYSRQAVQRAAHALISAGLVRAEPNPRHKRAPLLVATPLGEETKIRSEACLRLLAGDLSGTLDPENVSRLTGGLRQFREAVDGSADSLIRRLPS